MRTSIDSLLQKILTIMKVSQNFIIHMKQLLPLKKLYITSQTSIHLQLIMITMTMSLLLMIKILVRRMFHLCGPLMLPQNQANMWCISEQYTTTQQRLLMVVGLLKASSLLIRVVMVMKILMEGKVRCLLS